MSLSSPIHQRAANTIRILSAQAVEKAKSGHPGMPMGCAEIVHTLFFKYLRHNPANPNWHGRDKFILSAGHGSILLYTLFHLYGYDITKNDLMNFRQWGSKTPGHPEYPEVPGVEVTTGPLGSGFSSSVGMAIASKHFLKVTGLDKTAFPQDRMVVLMGDGCMMEGCTSESASLAGHLKLNNIIALYDSNKITIEGATDLAFSEDVGMRFTAYGWRVLTVENANDLLQCDAIFDQAFNHVDTRPTLVICKTKIGLGAPNKVGKSVAHGEPLGADEMAKTFENLNFDPAQPFEVEDEIKTLFNNRREELITIADQEFESACKWLAENPEQASLISQMVAPEIPDDLYQQLSACVAPYQGKSVATRQAGGDALQVLAKNFPSLIGGAADLAPSTKTTIKNSVAFTPATPEGRNIHFGVREFAMGLTGNGLSIYGTAIPFSSTFFVFSDYMKPALRLAAMQRIKHLFIFTHDSFAVGEDGPTHQPIEQLLMIRSIPGMTLFRPADAFETAAVYNMAIRMNTPVSIILTRQNLPTVSELEGLDEKVAKGAYIFDDEPNFEYILMATGSEVALAMDTTKLMREQGCKVRVVSMPSLSIFDAQNTTYKEEILPKTCTKRVSIEAATTVGWCKYTTTEGLNIGIDHFGASAPAQVLSEKFGFTPQAVAEKILKFFN